MSLKSLNSYYRRLASYRSMPRNGPMVYCTSLAQHGYFYTGHNMDIECEGCQAHIKVCPNGQKKEFTHLRGCVFQSSDDFSEHIDVNYEPNRVSTQMMVKDIATDGSMDSLLYGACDQIMAETDDGHSAFDIPSSTLSGKFQPSTHSDNYFSEIPETTLNDDLYLNTDGASSSPTWSLNYSDGEPELNKKQRERISSTSSSSLSSKSSGYHSDYSANSDELQEDFCLKSSTFVTASSQTADLYAFPDLFLSEHLWLNSSKKLSPLAVNGQECDKNPGHFAYFSCKFLKMEQIPTAYRCPDMMRLLELLVNLTARVIVAATSKLRKMEDAARINGCKIRAGSGFAVEHGCKTPVQKSKAKPHRSLLSLPKLKKKTFGLVFIQTSRHLVYNDEEAQNTTVEFFYDSPDRKDIVSLEGKYLLTSTIPGDNQCLLVCECSDHVFIQRLNQLQREFFGVAYGLPLKAKRGMSKKLFMVHHPHGGPKVVSYGDYVTVKYKLNISDVQNGKATLTKITALDQVGPDVSAYRKTLFYAADTCPGSSGAPILTFCPRQPGANGDVTFKLDIWMHNGVETSHKLGASVLKTCTKVDFQQPMLQSSIPEEDSEGEDSLGKQQVNSPVYKVVTTPSHPEFTLYQTRLESFIGWTMDSVLKPEYLALSGFYYTGDSDCVRCFQCGLGLRTWKQGDDVITEHEKYRPTCPYLKSLPKGQEVNRAATVSSLEAGTQSNENLPLKLLEAENTIIKNQLKCKVCFKSDIKDIFLPCGELYACSECSKLLTQCPSCGKQILATVTVYLN